MDLEKKQIQRMALFSGMIIGGYYANRILSQITKKADKINDALVLPVLDSYNRGRLLNDSIDGIAFLPAWIFTNVRQAGQSAALHRAVFERDQEKRIASEELHKYLPDTELKETEEKRITGSESLDDILTHTQGWGFLTSGVSAYAIGTFAPVLSVPVFLTGTIATVLLSYEFQTAYYDRADELGYQELLQPDLADNFSMMLSRGFVYTIDSVGDAIYFTRSMVPYLALELGDDIIRIADEPFGGSEPFNNAITSSLKGISQTLASVGAVILALLPTLPDSRLVEIGIHVGKHVQTGEIFVNLITPRSPASGVLSINDIIVSYNGIQINDFPDFKSAVQDAATIGRPTQVEVLRDGVLIEEYLVPREKTK